MNYLKTAVLTNLLWAMNINDSMAQLPAYSTMDDIQPEQAFFVNGVSTSETFGSAASGIGDFNNDGFDDIIIGDRIADGNGTNSGVAYVVFGNQSVTDINFNLADLNGSNGFIISGGGCR